MIVMARVMLSNVDVTADKRLTTNYVIRNKSLPVKYEVHNDAWKTRLVPDKYPKGQCLK